ncbi:hypothetical protein L1987_48758 [Smallanthus sonchifolius]|uniref:Uncharacterized protein n=1 Tax=Smallanthus sonchifolius TaxID=185202 RepID=A0ACB9FTV6_9ASTR|nr:hypothetical protein L1987_48758 [Smallanthus sonchifolius]
MDGTEEQFSSSQNEDRSSNFNGCHRGISQRTCFPILKSLISWRVCGCKPYFRYCSTLLIYVAPCLPSVTLSDDEKMTTFRLIR